MVKKNFRIGLTAHDELDVMIVKEKGDITRFTLNYRTLIGSRWHDIFRIDSAHGFLHEHRFWKGPESRRLGSEKPLNNIFTECKNVIVYNFQKYRDYYKKARK